MLLISIIGYTIPFFIFPWAQQYVESGLAGVYMAFMPVWTVFLAFFFADETLTPGKLAGFALGLTGALILMGPDVIQGAARSSVLAQVGLLVATFCYAASAILMRRTRAIRPRVFAAGTVLGAAVFATPALFMIDLNIDEWRLSSMASVVGLAVGPTGLAGLVIIMIVKRAGAGFMALANYLAPVWAVILGAIIFHERLEPRVFVALALILAGVAASQRRARTKAAPLALQTEPPQT
jgi:drug/metabolite transporter (DMT)-like permease